MTSKINTSFLKRNWQRFRKSPFALTQTGKTKSINKSFLAMTTELHEVNGNNAYLSDGAIASGEKVVAVEGFFIGKSAGMSIPSSQNTI